MTRQELENEKLAAAYRQYTLVELRWEWKSSISPVVRRILREELERRAVPMAEFDILGRGKPRVPPEIVERKRKRKRGA